jgi:[acyl-carrier-protein] S-malonyltransferase
MLIDLAREQSIVQQVFEQASEVLNVDLWTIVQQGPVDLLNSTDHTQPIMLAAGFAIWQIWCQYSDVRPFWMAGHSLGEYTALVCAGSISFIDAIRLVAERGRLMQDSVPVGTGAMAAIIGLTDQQVIEICEQVADHEIVTPVNFNAPGQVVIAGHRCAVERAMSTAKMSGAKLVVKLPVSVPSHCVLMQSSAQKLYSELQKIQIHSPVFKLVHNVDLCSYDDAEQIRQALRRQLFHPVRWVETIQSLSTQGVSYFVEIGPGRVLQGLNKRIVKSAEHFAIYDPKSLYTALEQLSNG